MTKYTINKEHSGIELYFDEKPAEAVISLLKSNRWRWHSTKKCWYNRDNEANRAITLTLANGEIKAAPETKPKPTNDFGVKVGDLFVASWGYEQTNLDFFQIVALRGKTSVLVREVRPALAEEKSVSSMSRDVSFSPTSEMLPPVRSSVFIKDNERGDLKRISGTKEHYYINMRHTTAHPYDGGTLYESWYA